MGPDKNSFNLKAKLNSDNDNLKVCAAYTGSKESTNMVVIEVELLSGFAAVLEALEQLQNEVDSGLRKVEFDKEKNIVVLYFDDMPKEERCINVEMKREVVVDKLQPALVRVYDYYNQQDVATIEYSLTK